MDINKQWQKLEQANFNHSIKKEEIMKAIQLESTSTIAEIKKRLGQKINSIKFPIAVFVGMGIYHYDNFGILSVLGLGTLILLIGYLILKQGHSKLLSTEDTSGTIMNGLKSNLGAIKLTLRKTRIFRLFYWPVMLFVVLSFRLFLKGATVSEVFTTEYSLSVILFYLVFILFLNYNSEKTNKVAFGEHITNLEDQIKEIEKVS